MAGLKLTIDGEKLEVDIDKLTAGEGWLLKREYGMDDFMALNVYDPAQLCGIAHIALKRKHPGMDESEAKTKAEGLVTGPVFEGIHKQMEAAREKLEAAEKDPQQPVASGSVASGKDRGGSGTTRPKRGPRK